MLIRQSFVRILATLLAILVPASIVVIGAAPSSAAPLAGAMSPPPGRAMWLWNWTDNAAVVSFAVSHHVTEIFAYTAPGFTDPTVIPPMWSQPEWPLITDLATRTRAAGIALDALGGDPSWVPNPAVAVSWAGEVVATGLFAGIHLDLEPWQLAEWNTDQPATIAQTVAVVAAVRAAAPGLALELSIPWWLYLYQTANGTSLDAALMTEADSVAIVTFFNDTSLIQSLGATELASAAQLGKPARLAVETNAVTPSWLTFAGTSQAVFTQTLDQIDAAHAATPGYLGVAVEDYTGWSQLPA